MATLQKPREQAKLINSNEIFNVLKNKNNEHEFQTAFEHRVSDSIAGYVHPANDRLT